MSAGIEIVGEITELYLFHSIPFMADKDMDLTFKVKELSNAIFNMQVVNWQQIFREFMKTMCQ